jgi:hypothetical protein
MKKQKQTTKTNNKDIKTRNQEIKKLRNQEIKNQQIKK